MIGSWTYGPADGVPPPVAPFAHATAAGETLYVTGQMPTGTDGKLVAGGIVEQTDQVMRNLARVLELVGRSGTISPVTRRANNDHAAILRRVRAIPPGYVRTYSDVSPGAPRLAGYVLSQTDARDAPWHRVVRADGSLAKGARQRRLLEAENVPFRGDRVLLSRAWLDDLDVI